MEESNKWTLALPGVAQQVHFPTREEKSKEEIKKRVEHDFTYHAPKPGQPEKYTQIREKAKELALLIVELTPVSREQSLALTHLEHASMMANAAIARNE